jgi:hypothetical protein
MFKIIGMTCRIEKPKRMINPDDVLTPSEAKKVHHGMKQIKEGRFKLWRNVKHKLGS